VPEFYTEYQAYIYEAELRVTHGSVQPNLIGRHETRKSFHTWILHQNAAQLVSTGSVSTSAQTGSFSYDPQFGMFAVASFTILTRVTTLSGTPGGGKGRFLGGGALS